MKVTIQIENECCDTRRGGRIIPSFGPITDSVGTITKTPQFHGSFPKCGENRMAAVSMNTVQEFTVDIKPVDKKGKPAPVDGAPTWLTDNPDVIAITPAADGMSCKVTAVGIPGVCNLQVTCDADLGEGVTPLVGTLEVNVGPAPATSIELNVGPVSDQP